MSDFVIAFGLVGWMLALYNQVRVIALKDEPKAELSEVPDEDPRKVKEYETTDHDLREGLPESEQ